jgi:hypothetical protein
LTAWKAINNDRVDGRDAWYDDKKENQDVGLPSIASNTDGWDVVVRRVIVSSLYAIVVCMLQHGMARFVPRQYSEPSDWIIGTFPQSQRDSTTQEIC